MRISTLALAAALACGASHAQTSCVMWRASSSQIWYIASGWEATRQASSEAYVKLLPTTKVWSDCTYPISWKTINDGYAFQDTAGSCTNSIGISGGYGPWTGLLQFNQEPKLVNSEAWKNAADAATQCAPVIPENSPKPKDCDPCNDPQKGNPISLLTGAKLERIPTGIVLGGVELVLTYDSTARAGAASGAAYLARDLPSVGALWKSSFHRKLSFSSAQRKRAALSRGTGQGLHFSGGPTAFTPDVDPQTSLVAASGGWRFTDLRDSTLEQYDAEGRLASLTTPQGMGLTFTYGPSDQLMRVVADDGRAVAFAYTNGLVTQITAPDSQKIQLAYDADSNLTGITWQDGKTLSFLYENATHRWAMTGKVDERGVRIGTYAYDTAGRSVSTEGAGGINKWQVSYSGAPLQQAVDTWDAGERVWYRRFNWQAPGPVTVTMPNGQTSQMTAVLSAGAPSLASRTQPAGSGNVAAVLKRSYDANGNATARDDLDGTRYCYKFDARDREVLRIEGLPAGSDCATYLGGAALPSGARKITTSWHPDWQLPVQVNEPRRRATTVYNGQPDPFSGGAVASCSPAPARADGKLPPLVCKVVQQSLSTDGTTVETAVASEVTTFTYDALGRLLSTQDGSGASSSQTLYADTAYTAASGDADISRVILLLHANGSEGSTAIVDDSGLAQSVSLLDHARISTAQSKFGGGSLVFDGRTDAVRVKNRPEFSFDTGDFTVEAWVMPTVADYGLIYEHVNGIATTPAGLFMSLNGNRTVSVGQAFGPTVLQSSSTVPLNAWSHVAVQRSAGQWTLFINGQVGGSATNAVNLAGTGEVTIGGNGRATMDTLTGYIDELRVTRGKARYSGAFTVRDAPFPNEGLSPDAGGHRAGDAQSLTDTLGHKTTVTRLDASGRPTQTVDRTGMVTDYAYTARGQLASVTETFGTTAEVTTYVRDEAGLLTQVQMPDGKTLGYRYDAGQRLVGIVDERGNAIDYVLDNTGERISEKKRDPSGALQNAITRVFDALSRLQQITGAAQ